MADFILIENDLVNFDPVFAAASVVVMPGKLAGTGAATVGGKKMCVEGDEGKVSVAGCAYTTPAFPTPGVGTLKISKLMPDQVAMKTASNKKKVLLKGAKFIAAFEVQTPAQLPTPTGPQTDPLTQYPGTGSFQTFNQKFQGT
jgi:hypothetical protein